MAKRLFGFGDVGRKSFSMSVRPIKYYTKEYNRMHRLMQGSRRAIIGSDERELVIEKKYRQSMITHLKKMGYDIIGTSYEPRSSKTLKIWYS